MAQMLYQGHGSYRFTLDDGTVIYVDPFAGEGYDKPADLILVTHEHFDHNQVKLAPHAPGCDIIRSKTAHPKADAYKTLESHGVTIMAVQAYNKNHDKSACCGFVLEFDGISFYASGDTSTTDDMSSGKLAALNLDYAALPIDGVFNMDAKEASACAGLIKAKHTIPVHMLPVNQGADNKLFSSLRAMSFKAAGKLVLKPGQTIQL